jgi:3-oxoacyl-(acyl-carrier-protein) synthase
MMIRDTYAAGGLDLKSTRYFESHGTGTAIGDPTEASAIAEVLSKDHRSSEDPLYIGAVKSNIGHLEGSVGIAVVIKTVLVLEKGVIPPNIHFEKVNPNIRVDDWNIKVSGINCGVSAELIGPSSFHLNQLHGLQMVSDVPRSTHSVTEAQILMQSLKTPQITLDCEA